MDILPVGRVRYPPHRLLNDAEQMIHRIWIESSPTISQIELATFVVKPNDVHGIIQLTDDAIAGTGKPENSVHFSRPSLPAPITSPLRKTFYKRNFFSL